MGPDAMILVVWMLSFKPALSLSSFTLIKRLFSSSSLSAIRVVSSAYLRLLIFLQAILTSACDSSIPAFHMIYFAWKLNKHYIQLWWTSFLILNQSISDANYCFLCCIQVSQEADKVVWYSHLFQNFPCLENLFVLIHTVKDFSTVNETEVVFFPPPGIPLLFLWSNRCWRFDLWVNHELVIFRLMKAFPVFSFIFVPWFISLVFPHIVYYRSILFIFVSLICGCKT